MASLLSQQQLNRNKLSRKINGFGEIEIELLQRMTAAYALELGFFS